MTRMNDQSTLIRNLMLAIIQRKGLVTSSYFLAQVMPRFGVITSVQPIIEELEAQRLVIHEGLFDDTSGLFKNITITELGQKFLEDFPLRIHKKEYVDAFGESDLLLSMVS